MGLFYFMHYLGLRREVGAVGGGGGLVVLPRLRPALDTALTSDLSAAESFLQFG